MQSEHLKHDDQNRKSARASQHQDDISVGSEQFYRHVFSLSISPQRFPRHSPNFSQLIQKSTWAADGTTIANNDECRRNLSTNQL